MNNNMKKMRERNKIRNKSSQITIFVIVALVIIAGMIIYFIAKNPGEINISPSDNPRGYIDDCVAKALSNVEDSLIKNNGFFDLTGGYINYDNTRVPYYCFASTELSLCTSKHSALSNEIKKEIYSELKPKVDKCFNDVKEQLKNYNYKEGSMNLSIEVTPKKIQIKIIKEISYYKNEQKISFNRFDNFINSPLFEFIFLTNEIVNQELDCRCGEESCNADMVKLSMDNREFEITKPYYLNHDEIYSIKEVLSGKKINFAVRNCYREPST